MAGRERHAQAVRPAGGWTAEGAANIYLTYRTGEVKRKQKGRSITYTTTVYLLSFGSFLSGSSTRVHMR